jgi:hypothetical protein
MLFKFLLWSNTIGEDENIAKIERFAKPIFKRFKFDIHKYGFYLDVETIHGTYPKYVTFPSYAGF